MKQKQCVFFFFLLENKELYWTLQDWRPNLAHGDDAIGPAGMASAACCFPDSGGKERIGISYFNTTHFGRQI